MVETHESVEEIEILLQRARAALGAFEEAVDYRRLLERLRTSSPAHPVLLARFSFGFLAAVCVVAGIAIMVVPMVSEDLARTLVKFEAVIPYVPVGVPALPAVFALLAVCWFVGWAMCTGAALAIGREAQMLPWEQRQHQQLVNEVTRLTTQRAVMERIRNTPVSSRPRIATPSVMSMRSPGPAPSQGGFGRSPTPSYLGRPEAAAPPVSQAPPMAAQQPQGGWTPSGFQRPTYTAPPPPGAAPSYGTPAGAPAPPYSPPAAPYGQPSAPYPAAPAAAQHQVPAPTGGTPPFDPGRSQAPPGPDPWDTPDIAPLHAAPPPAPPFRADGAATDRSSSQDFHRGPEAPTAPGGFPVPAAGASAHGMQVHAVAAAAESAPVAQASWIAPPDEATLRADEEPTTVRSASDPLPSAPSASPAVLQAEVVLEGLVSIEETGQATPPVPPAPPMYGTDDDDDVPTAVRTPSPPRAERRASAPSAAAPRTPAPAVPAPAPEKPARPKVVDPTATLPPPIEEEPPVPPRAPLAAKAPEEATTRRTAQPPAPATMGPAVSDSPAPSRPPPATPSRPPAAPPVTRTVSPAPALPPAARKSAENGILSRARAGAHASRATPHGSAGRIRPPAPPADAADGPPPPSVRARRRGQQITPLGTPDTRPAARTPHRRRRSHQTILEDEDDAPTVLSTLVDHEDSDASPGPSDHAQPDVSRVSDQWLKDAVAKAQQLAQNFPVQAQLAYSREPNLPFTLLINRATPAMAVRAMVNFVEFLAGIYTPPRARIELHGVAHLDKSFHRNVVAALEPYFGNNVIVEPSSGMVDIRFTDPDPGWGQYPTLPLR